MAGILALVPANSENVEVYDFEEIRREEPPGALADEFEDLTDTGLEELGVLTDEIRTLVFASGDDWYLIVVEGDIDLVHVRDQLEDHDYDDDQYRGSELWEGAAWRHESVALFEDRRRMVIGDTEAVKSVLRSLDRGSGSLLDDADNDLGRALKRAGTGWVSFAQEQCPGYGIRGCLAVGVSLRRGGEEYLVEMTIAVLFRNERTAEPGMDELESQLEEDTSFELDIDDVHLDGDFVVVTASGDEDDLFEGEGSVSGTPTATAMDDAPDTGDDHEDSADGATFATVGDAVTGALEHGRDVDYFAFAAERGQTYRIEVDLGTLNDSVMTLYDSDSGELAFDDDGGESWGSRITWTAAEPGTHYVAVAGWGSDTGSYTLTITPVRDAPDAKPPETRDDHGDSADEATSLAVGDAVTGVLDHGGDVDYFAFVAEPGETYRIDVDLGTLDDSVAALFATDLRELAFDDDSGASLGSRITWTAAESGTHYVGVAGWGSDTGTYTLTVTATGDAPDTRDDQGGSAHEGGFAPYPGDTLGEDDHTSGFGGSCTFSTRSADPHRSGDSVVAQGWWMVDPGSECPIARVDVILYGWWCDSAGCRWRRIANGSSIVRPEAASDQTVTAARICTSGETTGMRSVVDVDLLDITDSSERSVSVANVDCRPPDLQPAVDEPEASREADEPGSGTPDNPANQRYEYDGSAVVLTWDTSPGADSYTVYYDDFFDSACRAGPGGPSFCEELATNLSSTSYTHVPPDPSEHYYWVVACNRFGCSAVDSENPARVGGLPPAAPANQRYEYDGSTIALRWDASDSADSYTVYYDDFFDSSCSLRSSGPSFCEELATDLSGTTYTHTSPDRGENYYWVVACNRFGCSAIDSQNPARELAR